MKKALLVIDVQEDYLGENRNKEKFCYKDPEFLINNINRTIEKYEKDGFMIIYIAEILPDIITNRWIFGFSIKGTEGAKLVSGLNIVSDYYFEKQLPSAFTNKKFSKLIRDEKIDEVVLCGIDEAGCVGETAKSALKLKLKTFLVEDSIDSKFGKRAETLREKLKRSGAKYI